MAEFATEGGHFYAWDGSTRYEVMAANGKLRSTNVKDAKKHGWVPSFTTVIKLMAAPALLRWMLNNALLSGATLPRIEGETADDWVERVNRDMQEEARRAKEGGERIHGALDKHHRGEAPDPEYLPWVHAVSALLEVNCGPQEWSPEKSFAHALGYGGRVDLHSPEWVIDFKTKSGPADGRKLWDEEIAQLGAYRRGLGIPKARCAIVHIDRNQPHAEFIEATEEQLERGVAMFDCLLELWKVKNNYRPEAFALAA